MSKKYPELDDDFGEGWTAVCPKCKTAGGWRPGRVDHPDYKQPICLRCASGIPDPILNKTPRIGRNDQCSCGSGAKYKHCCLKKGPYESSVADR